MNKIPKNIKYSIFGISALIFFLLNSVLGLNIITGATELIQKITGYHFGISTNTFDYLTFASIPIFGMLLNSQRNEFKVSELIRDVFTVLLWTIIVVGIGLYILTIIGKPTNPLIPDYLIIEPINIYSTLIMGIGILIPFLFSNRNKKQSEIQDIGTEN